MNDYVFVDPDGTLDPGLLLLVLRPTGVVYASQVAGYGCELRSAEGFLIPLGQEETEKLFTILFEEFRGWPPDPLKWTQAQLSRLKRLLGYVRVWRTYVRGESKDEMFNLALDMERISELTEAWIPVTSPYGPAVLLFKNSD